MVEKINFLKNKFLQMEFNTFMWLYIIIASGVLETALLFVFFQRYPSRLSLQALPIVFVLMFFLLEGFKIGAKNRTFILKLVLFLTVLGPFLYFFNIWYSNWQATILNSHLEGEKLFMLEIDYAQVVIHIWHSLTSSLALVYLSKYKKLRKKTSTK